MRRGSLRMRHRRSLLALALLAAASCDLTGGGGSGEADPGRLAELDVQEAALRWAFANADTELRPTAVNSVALA